MTFGLIRRDTPGFVYFAHCPHLELVKIGWSLSPTVRLSQIVADVRCDLRLIGTLRGTKVTERREQTRFAHLWYGSEWFFEDSPLLAYAARLREVIELQDRPYTGGRDPRYPEFQVARRKWAPARGAHWPLRVRERRSRELYGCEEGESS